MIHWAWLILALFFGGFVGFLGAAICTAAGAADREIEKYEQEMMKK